MKGGVTCLRAMFSRKAKAKNAMILQKPENEDFSPSTGEYEVFSQDLCAESGTAVTFVNHANASGWTNGEVHLFVADEVINNDVESSPSVKSDNPEHVAVDIDVAHGSVVNSAYENETREAEYEGEDEDEDGNDSARLRGSRDCDSDHPLSDGASEFTLIPEYSAHTEVLDKDSARYYETSVNGTYSSKMMDRENSYTDLDMGSGHVSDPGFYHKIEVESLCSSPLLSLVCQPEEKEKSEVQLQKQASIGVTSEAESVRHPDSFNTMLACQMVSLSYGSSSTGGEARNLPSGACITTGESPRSETACQLTANHAIFKLGASIEAVNGLKKKPWWKVFLASHRNIHRVSGGGVLGSLSEGDAGRVSPINGYVSDVEARSGLVSPSLLNGGVSDSEKDPGNVQGLDNARVPVCAQSRGKEQVENSGIVLEISKSEHSSCEIVPEAEGSLVSRRTAENWDHFTEQTRNLDQVVGQAPTNWDRLSGGRTRLSRVEQWVDNTFPSALDQWANITYPASSPVEDGSESPVAPAASFFEAVNEEVEWLDFEDTRQAASGATRDGTPDADAEMAKMVIRSVNPLSTVAHFSGVGLKAVPSLGVFTNLKLLNLSANSFVRIAPGCLPKSLHSLDISRNKIVMIEGLRDLTRLRVLNLSFNRVARIGNGLSGCTSLKELYLTGNKISEVEGLHRLSKLVVLDLSFNKLTTTKSLGQIAANYKSLQALNLLANAVQSNLGDEQMRRFVTGICPQLMYLNKQALKSVSTRESAIDNVARAAMGKEPKGSGKNPSKPSKRTSAHQSGVSHRRTHSGGSALNSKIKSGSKGGLSPVLVQDSYHRKIHSHKPTSSKELPKGFVPLPPTASTSHGEIRVQTSRRAEMDIIPRVQSDGVLFREENRWIPNFPRGVVQAH